jgi:hypothetical protein
MITLLVLFLLALIVSAIASTWRLDKRFSKLREKEVALASALEERALKAVVEEKKKLDEAQASTAVREDVKAATGDETVDRDFISRFAAHSRDHVSDDLMRRWARLLVKRKWHDPHGAFSHRWDEPANLFVPGTMKHYWGNPAMGDVRPDFVIFTPGLGELPVLLDVKDQPRFLGILEEEMRRQATKK